MSYANELPVVGTFDSVPFPGQYYHVQGNESSAVFSIAKLAPKHVLLVPFASQDADEARLFGYGVIAKVLQTTMRRRGVKLAVRTVCRAKVVSVTKEGEAFPKAHFEPLVEEDMEDTKETLAFRQLVQDHFQLAAWPAVVGSVKSTPIGPLADAVANAVGVSYEDRLKVLAAANLTDRIKLVALLLARSSKGTSKALVPAPKRAASAKSEVEGLRERLLQAEVTPGEARDSIMADLTKLERMQKSSSDYQVMWTYLDFCSKLPWNKSTPDAISLAAARKQLDDDHYGLDDVKKRIVEYLAVLKLRQDLKAPLLCFIGPPGTGKSSLGQSIATALGRKFHRISLGGVRDEAVIRGHRRTYVGAMCGRILDAMRKTGVKNPVILLDEIDKMGMDQRGDPAAALLEVLDPVQNGEFTDHYLGVPFDLSKVMFIATGNSPKIPAALRDRMELIDVPGYSFEEKVHIANQNLLPRQLKEHGMPEGSIELTEGALLALARSYTRESGVRTMNRLIAAVVRWVVASVVSDGEGSDLAQEGLTKSVTTVTEKQLEDILGPPKYEEDARDRLSRFGVSIGLGFTGTGSGSILYIECAQMASSDGKVHITGSLGDVMKESVNIAVSWIRSNPETTFINGPILDGMDLHVHFPDGATPKDGPSAGVAITVALVSLLSKRLVRSDAAMTGEMSLSGIVLPVGGIKEKVLAAHRNGLRRVYLPARNMKDLHNIPDAVKNDISFIPTMTIDDVLATIFDDAGHLESKL